MKSDRRVPMAMTTSASRATAFAAEPPVAPTGPSLERVVPGERSLARLCLGHRDAEPGREGVERALRGGVQHAATGHDHRPLGAGDGIRCPGQQRRVGPRSRHDPGALLEQLVGEVPRLRLDVLRQAQGHRAGLRGDVSTRNAAGSAVTSWLGPVDAVPVARHRPECVVDAHVLALRPLQLLEHGRHPPGAEQVPGQQQHRQPVDRGGRGTRDHVRGARPDGAGAGERAQPSAAAWRMPPRCGPSPARCAPGDSAGHRAVGGRLRLERLAQPATLPCPKMPNTPAMNRPRSPSRSTYCWRRNATTACAVVRRRVPPMRSPPPVDGTCADRGLTGSPVAPMIRNRLQIASAAPDGHVLMTGRLSGRRVSG